MPSTWWRSPQRLRSIPEAMAAVRDGSDALELKIADDLWPMPKYREMLFPV